MFTGCSGKQGDLKVLQRFQEAMGEPDARELSHPGDVTMSISSNHDMPSNYDDMPSNYDDMHSSSKHDICIASGNDMPITSFPDIQLSKSELQREIAPILINSDPRECNQNLCSYFKLIVDNLYFKDNGETNTNYHHLSVYALKLLNSNLFTKNYILCIGKMLSLLRVFVDMQNSPDYPDLSEPLKQESNYMKEFLCITLLLLLKLKNNPNDSLLSDCGHDDKSSIETNTLFQTLIEVDFVTIIANLIESHITHSEVSHASFVLLKFCGDIIFEYLYHVVLLSDREFHNLTDQTDLIPTLIRDLLSNENFNNYDIDGDDFEDEDKLIAYEEFKLLLLINEQYLMKSYSSKDIHNKVFDGLINGSTYPNNHNGSSAYSISGFINLLVYHINREESHIIKILILKFFYLVFTSSYTAKLPYVNDLKILVDIFVRELNDLDYTNEPTDENRVLIITYLKVMYPLLMFSSLSELEQGYKVEEILNLLRNLILYSDPDSDKRSPRVSQESREAQQENVIGKLASKCLSVSWLNQKNKRTMLPKRSDQHDPKAGQADLPASLESQIELSNDKTDFDQLQEHNTSSDSLSFTRIASVRTSSALDYHKHTTSHNLEIASTDDSKSSSIVDNNGNVFLKEAFTNNSCSQPSQAGSNLLDLPKEYLKNKPLPSIIQNHQSNSSSSSLNSSSSLARKALRKKAPPPPPPPHGRNHAENHLSAPMFSKDGSRTPPPPPPPRRRR